MRLGQNVQINFKLFMTRIQLWVLYIFYGQATTDSLAGAPRHTRDISKFVQRLFFKVCPWSRNIFIFSEGWKSLCMRSILKREAIILKPSKLLINLWFTQGKFFVSCFKWGYSFSCHFSHKKQNITENWCSFVSAIANIWQSGEKHWGAKTYHMTFQLQPTTPVGILTPYVRIKWLLAA